MGKWPNDCPNLKESYDISGCILSLTQSIPGRDKEGRSTWEGASSLVLDINEEGSKPCDFSKCKFVPDI